MCSSTRKEKMAGTRGRYNETAGRASSREALWRAFEGLLSALSGLERPCRGNSIAQKATARRRFPNIHCHNNNCNYCSQRPPPHPSSLIFRPRNGVTCCAVHTAVRWRSAFYLESKAERTCVWVASETQTQPSLSFV